MESLFEDEKVQWAKLRRKIPFQSNLHTLRIRKPISGRHCVVDEADARESSQDAFNLLLILEQGSVETSLIYMNLPREYRFSIFEASGLQDAENIQRKNSCHLQQQQPQLVEFKF